MPYSTDIPQDAFSFLKGNRGGVGLEERGKGLGGEQGGEYYHDVIYERNFFLKGKRWTIQSQCLQDIFRGCTE